MSQRRVLDIGQAILAKNQGLAHELRKEFSSRGLLVLNLVSSPGSGKTELLARTLDRLAGELNCGVIVGDLETDNDARRLGGRGAKVLQVNTDGYCHLEANMIRAAAERLGIDELRLLFIENVGNLVCPSSHDLGEDIRVALLSTTEGEDKPLKYPTLFKTSQVVMVTKLDLAAAVEFDLPLALANIAAVAPQAKVFQTSAKSGAGVEEWCEYLRSKVTEKAQGFGALRS